MIRRDTSSNRTASLLRCVPELFTRGERSLLYVGAREARTEFAEELYAAGATIDVIEIWPPNATYLRGQTPRWLRHVFDGDVRQADLRPLLKYDVAFWWHGPEHVHRDEALIAVERLQSVASLVVLGCPWGDYPQGATGGNPHEAHLWAPEPEDFEAVGFDVEVLPPRGRGGNILSWWRRPR